MANREIPEPWLAFLKEVDQSLDSEISFHCFGGFAITVLFGLPRETADMDVVGAVVRDRHDELQLIAGKGSRLHQKHKVYLDLVGTIAVLPDSYDERLIPIETGFLNRIRLHAMEPHDIILAKLGRDAPKDNHDVRYLAKVAELDTDLLRSRYRSELHPYVIGLPERSDRTLDHWIRMIEEIQAATAKT
jgi:hypothetical protein